MRAPSKLVLVAADRPQEDILQAHSGGCWSCGPLLRLPPCPQRAEGTKAMPQSSCNSSRRCHPIMFVGFCLLRVAH